MQYKCCLPHVIKHFEIPSVSYNSLIFHDICAAHLRYFLGLEELCKEVRVTGALRENYPFNADDAYAIRGPSLHAAQNITFSKTEECKNVVFAEGDVVIPTSAYAAECIKTVRENPELILNNNYVFINGPITRYYRCLNTQKQWVEQQQFFNYQQYSTANTFQKVVEILEGIVVDKAVVEAHDTYLTYILELFKVNLNKPEPEAIAKNPMKSAIFQSRALQHMRIESFQDQLAAQYLHMFPDANKFSGAFLLVMNGIDTPVGPNPKDAASVGPGGCPPAPDNDTRRYPFTYRYSLSIPNVVYDENKGFVATRNIFDGEELTLEPFDDSEARYLPINSVIFLKYNGINTHTNNDYNSRQDMRSLFPQLPSPQPVPQNFVQTDLQQGGVLVPR